MNRIIVVFTIVSALLGGGCGVISRLGTPTRYEKKVPAEYDITKRKGEKILVLVKQPLWLDAQENLRFYLTGAMNAGFVGRMKWETENLVSYEQLSKFRSARSDFSLLSPARAGKELGADMVLFVMVEDFELNRVEDAGLYKGALAVQTVLFDAAGGNKLWPVSEKSKAVRVGFDVESGREKALTRLAGSAALCTTRYLFNCPVAYYKTFDDISGQAWQNW
jgi:hypothetical protein